MRVIARSPIARPPWVVVLAITILVATMPGAAAPAALEQVLMSGVAPDATAENSQRKLVADGRGGLYLAYASSVDGIPQVFLATSVDHGRSWRHEQVTRSASPARLPSLSAFPDRTLHLVWTEYVPVGRVPYRVLRGTQWSEERILSQPGIYAGVPAVAPFEGRPYVLWYGIRPEAPRAPTRHASIYEILETHSAGPQWTPPLLISPGVPDSINPSLDVTADGHLHAAWFQFDGRVYQIRTADFAGAWSRPRSLTAGPVDHTRVALAADGRDVYLVWQEQTEPLRVMYRRLDGDAAVRLSGSGSAGDPVVAAAGGVVVAAWSEGQSIVLRTLKPSGPGRVLGTGRSPVVAVYQDTAYVAWVAVAGSLFELRFASVRLR